MLDATSNRSKCRPVQWQHRVSPFQGLLLVQQQVMVTRRAVGLYQRIAQWCLTHLSMFLGCIFIWIRKRVSIPQSNLKQKSSNPSFRNYIVSNSFIRSYKLCACLTWWLGCWKFEKRLTSGLFWYHLQMWFSSRHAAKVKADDTQLTIASRSLQMAWEVIRKTMPRSMLQVSLQGGTGCCIITMLLKKLGAKGKSIFLKRDNQHA